MTLEDPECQNKGFIDFFWQFRAVTHITGANCAEITTDRSVQPAYKIFDVKHSFKRSKSRPHMFKVACT